jgi:ABC-type Fe3+-hydroxamate transport system substrate-binding protein
MGPAFEAPARRVVSLVPSLTHALFELGAGSAVVGRTEFCVRPAEGLASIEAIGGTKNPDVDRVRALAPELVLANREENTRRRVERIAERVPVLLTDPHSPSDVPPLWRVLGEVTGRGETGERLAREVEAELGRAAESPSAAAPSFVYWIWRDPWMAAGHGTYISTMLEAAGWRNALPADCSSYPKVEPSEVDALVVQVMLFSSEPYAFSLPRDLDAFPGPAVEDGGLWRLPGGMLAAPVDGQLLSWYPSLTASGLRLARELRRRLPLR